MMASQVQASIVYATESFAKYIHTPVSPTSRYTSDHLPQKLHVSTAQGHITK